MREYEKEFNARNVKIVIVTFENDYFARMYTEETGLPWPLLIDESRRAYKEYGMLNASFWDVWGPRTIIAYAKGLLQGKKLAPSKGDIYQRGGDVLIDPGGIVRLHHVGEGPADRPDAREILSAIAGASQ